MKKPAIYLSLFFLLFFSTQNAFAQPANDACSSAVTLTSGVANSSGTVWAATGGTPTSTVGNPDDDVWYKFTTGTGTQVATITLSAIGSDLSASGALVELLSGTACASWTSLGIANGSISPLVVSGLSASTVYYVRVFSYATGALASSAGSTFTITYNNTIFPTNDESTAAIFLPTSTDTIRSYGWLQGATTSTGVTNCSGTVKYDVWYKFVATKSNPTIKLESLGNNISGNECIQLFNNSFTSLSCATGTALSASLTASGLTVGATYYIRVYSNTASATTFTQKANFEIMVVDPGSPAIIDSTATLFTMDTVAKNLAYPWEITYGPDDSLWITEARGYRVLRISSTRTQAKIGVAPQQILKLPMGGTGNPGPTFDRTLDNGGGTWPQGGMEGLAIRPDWTTSDTSTQYVYIAYVYAGTCPSNPGSGSPCIFRSKIVRCRFYYAADALNPSLRTPKQDSLVIKDTLLSNLSGSNDHNSGRLKINPVKEGSTYKLYYTIGDMGAGQFNNDMRTNNAQNKDTCEGKILRLNTVPDGDASFGITHQYNTFREWIPNDNPFTHSVNGLRTPVYSYGHRNAQGLAFGQVNGTWRLYQSEHGDRSGDEVNIIQSGKNYGWPLVTGMADNNYTTDDDINDGFTQNNVLANKNVSDETTFAGNTANFARPMFDFFNWTPSQIQTIDFNNIFTWPTIAPSSIDFYDGNIPGWKNSLLVTSLKYGMFRLKLNTNGDFVDSTASSLNSVDTFPLLHGWRIRDVAINPNKNSGQFWAITDSSGSTSGPTGGFNGGNNGTANGGRVLRLTYKTLITLPVTYTSFTGKLMPDKTIALDWQAQTDQSFAYFIVEKSINNTMFSPIGQVMPLAPEHLIDPNPNIGNNYYRIRNVTKDGSFSYSNVIDVVYDPTAYLITAYPNPVKDILTVKINSPKSDNLQLRITDMQGRFLYMQTRYMMAGTEDVQIDVSAWSGGLYSLQVMSSDNRILTTQKIVKQ